MSRALRPDARPQEARGAGARPQGWAPACPPVQPTPARAPQQVITVAAVGLHRSFRLPGRRGAEVSALAGVSLHLPAASLTALVGASGCGKTTLLQCIAGLDRPTSGSVSLLGRPTSRMRAGALAAFRAQHVGFVFQDDNLVTSLSAWDNVALPGRLRRRPLGRDQIGQALERVGLTAQARHLPHQMSGGERQRVAIARVLASAPDIVFADEPTAALDVGSGDAVLHWFEEIAAGGATVLMVTHDAAAAARAQQVLVMEGGRIVTGLEGGDPQAVSAAVLGARRGRTA
ncbi:ABC transporter ATP-binding protein [Actinomyces bowdenii]|uniref:ABC transporter ATP-binding protein n=1 Tax=Actinomyces bowdenii TaxID=131109 RepID=A0A3P1V6E2_9ACTO|nr:ABC transporter ATP-binding protein [Actinomyces bowdenii]